VSLRVYDVRGRCVETLTDSPRMEAGRHEYRLPAEGWRGGLYFCRLEGLEFAQVQKVVVLGP
jgi:hypothetical protein